MQNIAGVNSKTINIIMKDFTGDIQFITMLLARIERISADSCWAHRASGLRGALLRVVENMEKENQIDHQEIELLITSSIKILEKTGKDLISP
jgi:hypothetical protein